MSEEQRLIVENDSKYLLVIAGAGCGKTYTIIKKINYLLEHGYNSEDILVISFTNNSVNDIKNKINNNVEVTTFHKLALNILNSKGRNIITDYELDYMINEFFSYNLTPSLVRKLKKYLGVDKYYQTKEYKAFKSQIKRYLNLYKANNGSLLKMAKITLKNCLVKSRINFIILFMNFYYFYEAELNASDSYDFNDLIIKASKEKINLKYKYIIIDEFQDTSLIRLKLINKIVRTNDSNLMVVGDDYQSIYQFSGSNLDIFLNFKEYYPDTMVLKLTKTFRNSNELVEMANQFILKNPLQIKKTLTSDKHIDKPITIIYYHNYEQMVTYVTENLKDCLFLGRNNSDAIPEVNFLTIHKSKGLESDNVVILNVNDDILGFPNQIKNNKLVSDLINSFDNYLYAEERRLFYVALTRTRNKVYIMVLNNKKSLFVKELENDYNDSIEFIWI